MNRPVNDAERSRLGLDTPISRRDFLNGSLAATGSLLAPRAGPAVTDLFTGYGGVGDYSQANGNTWPVVQAAHRLRDGGYSEALIAAARDAGQFDLIIVGGGIAGLSAAHRFRQLRGATARILILENHAMPGGEARQNEFVVGGTRLLGPQGSNDFGLPGQRSDSLTDAFFDEFSLPREYRWQHWDSALKPLRFARDNYSNMDGFQETQVDVGYFFERGIVQRSTEIVELNGDLSGKILYHVTTVIDNQKGTLTNTGDQVFSGTIAGSEPVIIHDISRGRRSDAN